LTEEIEKLEHEKRGLADERQKLEELNSTQR